MNNKSIFEIALDLGLSNNEYDLIIGHLKREPTITEIGIFSAMWSEHCSYKTSRYWLKKLPTQAPWVIQGPGENAGIIDIGNDTAAVFKIESHNHPSFIEPYQGAATGVGGIMRDIFTMGARPVANLNCIRFGEPDNPKTKHLLKGVVSGIGDYGNCIGVPTVGGECSFDHQYNDNILVNAMTLGIVNKNKIFYAKSGDVGNSIIYVGAKTGRDGIHGASMASGSFDNESSKLKPTVQVGDPFAEKLLLEACLELMEGDSIVGIQDMGAAGLTSSSIEMAANDGLGIKLNLDKVPVRDEKMSALEIMLSESQERMLMVIKPGSEKNAYKVFKKWDLNVIKIGIITNTGKIEIFHRKEKVANLNIKELADGISYIRPHLKKAKTISNKVRLKHPLKSILTKMLSSPNYCSKEWIWEQYDHMISNNIVNEQGENASIIRLEKSKLGLAVTTDCNINYCKADPYLGAIQAVAESFRNLISVGSIPKAITNCLNFGNPEKPEIMGEFTATIKGIKEASLVLKMPVISGNVSFYNETNDKNIPPTPQIGAVGVIKNIKNIANIKFKPKDLIFVLGTSKGHLSCSAYERLNYSSSNYPKNSTPPSIDLIKELKNGLFINKLIENKIIETCHDVSDGGILLSIAEMCLASNIGCDISTAKNDHGYLFGEDQSRYILSISEEKFNTLKKLSEDNNIKLEFIGKVNDLNDCMLKLPDKSYINIVDLSKKTKSWFYKFIG